MTRASCCTDIPPLTRDFYMRLLGISLAIVVLGAIVGTGAQVAPPDQQQQLATSAPRVGLGQRLSDTFWATANQLTLSGAAKVSSLEDHADDDHDQNNNQSQRAGFKLVRAIFDFGAYKRLFHKSYASILEELASRKYFLARAFRAFVSAIKYKHRQLTYYLAINHMSDLSPQELDQMDNKVLDQEASSQLELLHERLTMTDISEPQVESTPPLPELDPERAEAKIEEFFERNWPAKLVGELLDLGRDQLAKVVPLLRLSRKKRDLQSEDEDEAEKSSASEPLVSGPFSEMSFIVQNKDGPVRGKQQAGKQDPPRSMSQAMSSQVAQDDEVFVDHRKSGCMFEPRGQGKCGSCYSFSIVAYMEWLYCFKTRKLLAFSEQYLIDCGKARVGNLNGCSGGGRFSIGDFVMNFGLELRSNYPYRMREDHCPYSQEMRLQETGSFRWTGLESGSSIPMDLWPIYLKNGPMIVSLSTTNTGFKEYGGGVYDGAQCNPTKSNHMMLLVGHGREDNQEYWLIRNSYTVGWGEQGYYKLSKSANCVYLAKGFMYGTSDGGRTFAAEPTKNKLNRDKHVKNHYARHMANQVKKMAR